MVQRIGKQDVARAVLPGGNEQTAADRLSKVRITSLRTDRSFGGSQLLEQECERPTQPQHQVLRIRCLHRLDDVAEQCLALGREQAKGPTHGVSRDRKRERIRIRMEEDLRPEPEAHLKRIDHLDLRREVAVDRSAPRIDGDEPRVDQLLLQRTERLRQIGNALQSTKTQSAVRRERLAPGARFQRNRTETWIRRLLRGVATGADRARPDHRPEGSGQLQRVTTRVPTDHAASG